jgi:hypothetical protein
LTEPREFLVGWQHRRGAVNLTRSLLWQADVTGACEPDFQVMQLRWLCNVILGAVPDRALEEALESLVGIYEFYSLPAPPSTPLLQEPSKRLKAKIGRSVERPPFRLPEE